MSEYKMKKFSLGVSDFKNLIKGGYCYVDKSLFIKDVLDDGASVILLPRPRRFGKTLNMSMLRCFFEKNYTDDVDADNADLFDGLKIKSDPCFDKHQGKYPVGASQFWGFKICIVD